MYEKVSKHHPDKVADRVAGAVVDQCYTQAEGGWLKSNPRVAVEVLLGHREGLVIIETSEPLRVQDVSDTVRRISGIEHCTVRIVPQDPHLAANQQGSPKCGDNGIAKGTPVTPEQRELTALIRTLDETFRSDAKAVLTPDRLIVCQSNASHDEVFQCIQQFVQKNGYGKTIIGRMTPAQITINPLGSWTGGLDTDSGATNRKLGSDLGDAVTGGGLAGKDLSKADVSCQIVAHMLAQQHQTEVTAAYAIGDEEVTFHINGASSPVTMPYSDIVEQARLYVFTQHGSFEKFAEYGLIA